MTGGKIDVDNVDNVNSVNNIKVKYFNSTYNIFLMNWGFPNWGFPK